MDSARLSHREYPILDILKFTFSLLIVLNHVFYFQYVAAGRTMGPGVLFFYGCFNRTLVPFYFVTASYLLFSKMRFDCLDTERIKSYVLRIARMFAVWSILLVIGFREGYQEHLWFLKALCVAVTAVSLLLYRKVSKPVLIVIGLVLYIIALFGMPYLKLLDALKVNPVMTRIVEQFPNTRNGLCMGVPYVLIGAFLSQKPNQMRAVPAAIGLAVSLALMYCEVLFITKYQLMREYDLCIMQLPVAYFMFSLALNIRMESKPIYKRLRIVGMLVYFIHFSVIRIYQWVIDLIQAGCQVQPDSTVRMYLTSAAVSLAVAFAVENLMHKPRFGWLRYLC